MLRMTICFLLMAVSFLSTTAQAGPSIIISEVFYDTPGTDALEEWVEFYNPTGNAADIGGWELHDNSKTIYRFPAGTILLPGQTLIVARNTLGFRNLYGFDPDLDKLKLSLNNDGDFLKLFDLTDQLVDVVAWEGGLPGWDIEATRGQSLKRTSTGQGPGAWLGNQSPGPGSPSIIPEPASVVLMGAGLAFFVAFKKRRKQRIRH